MLADAILLSRILDSVNDHIVFCDENHMIRYMNARARTRYAGTPAQVGRSILECHNDASNAMIVEVAKRLHAGEDEVLVSDGETSRAYMRAVRDDDGRFIGYWERHETVARP